MDIPQKGTLAYGAWNALNNGLRVKHDERVLIITDAVTASVGDAFFEQAFNLTNRPPHFFQLEIFGRPLQEYPREIKEILPSVAVSVYAASAGEGELATFRKNFLRDVVKHDVRHGHGISITEQIMLDSVQTDYTLIAERCEALYQRLHGTPWARITAPGGTDVVTEFLPSVIWAKDNGIWLPNQWHNIPSGEIFTAPHNTKGIIVIDGVLGDHFDTRYGLIHDKPLVWRVYNNHVIDVACNDAELETAFRSYIAGPTNRSMIGELGIGVLDTQGLIGLLLQDEKMRGTLHFAVGDNLADHTKAPDNKADNHCDGVIIKPTLTLANGDVILKDGVYQSNA